jgi:hypothetical protein
LFANRQASPSEIMVETGFVDAFEQARPKRRVHAKRGIDDLARRVLKMIR